MSQYQLLRTRRFLPLFLTQFFGAFNDNLFKNTLALFVVFHSSLAAGDTRLVALAQGLFILPFMCCSAWAGEFADAHDKTRIIRMVKLAEIGIMCGFAVALSLGNIPALFVLLLCMGLHSTFFGPVKFSILPQHLATRELIGGNGLIEMGTFLAILLGLIFAGLGMIIAHGTQWIIALTLCNAIAGYCTSRAIPSAPPLHHDAHLTWNPFTLSAKLIRMIWQQRTLWNTVLGISWFWFFGALVLTLLPNFCKDVLHGDASVVTFASSVVCVGIALGSLWCERLSAGNIDLGIVPMGSLGMSAFLIDLYFASRAFSATTPSDALFPLTQFVHHAGSVRVLIDCAGLSVSSGLFVVPLQAFLQWRSPPNQRSRVIAANGIVNAIFMIASALIIMVAHAAHISIPVLYGCVGIANIFVALYIYRLIPEFFLRFLAWVLMHTIYRLEVTGREHVPTEGAALVVCNHITYVDGLFIAAASPRPIRFVMHHAMAALPIVRYFAKRGRVIPIGARAENMERFTRAMQSIEDGLRAGEIVVVFPEGKLTRSGEMNEFRPGVEWMLQRIAVPVIPMALQGLWGSAFSKIPGNPVWRAFRRIRSRVGLVIAPPLAPDTVTAEKLHAIVAQMRGDRR